MPYACMRRSQVLTASTRSAARFTPWPPRSGKAGEPLDLDQAALGGVEQIAHADQGHRREVLAEVLAVDAADRLDLALVLTGVEHVDRELYDVGELAAAGGDRGLQVLAHLTELGDQVALADDAP